MEEKGANGEEGAFGAREKRDDPGIGNHRRHRDEHRHEAADPTERPGGNTCHDGQRKECSDALALAEIQVVGEILPLEHQTCPRERAAEDLCVQHSTDAPYLERLSLHGGVEKDFASGVLEAIAEIDVLDRWIPVARRVEATELHEEFAVDGAAAAPES